MEAMSTKFETARDGVTWGYASSRIRARRMPARKVRRVPSRELRATHGRAGYHAAVYASPATAASAQKPRSLVNPGRTTRAGRRSRSYGWREIRCCAAQGRNPSSQRSFPQPLEGRPFMAETPKQVRCSFCQTAFDDDLELTPLRSAAHRRLASTSSFCSTNCRALHPGTGRAPPLRHWRRATSSRRVRCSSIGYSTFGDKAGDQTRRSSSRLPKPPVAAL